MNQHNYSGDERSVRPRVSNIHSRKASGNETLNSFYLKLLEPSNVMCSHDGSTT